MLINQNKYLEIVKRVADNNATLVAVSKTKTIEAIKELYDLGQRDFGENYVQELLDKQKQLPQDIQWHFIGHLQSNKIKFIAPFVHLIHGIDNFKLLKEVNKQAEKIDCIINVLLQIHIAQEETKFGMDENELHKMFSTNSNPAIVGYSHLTGLSGEELNKLKNVRICGLMGMASFTKDEKKIEEEFRYLKSLFDKYNSQFSILSMGMSNDYQIALQQGSNMVRIGSLIFGERQYA